MKWKVTFDLERPDDARDEDETWFDISHIKSEIRSWLEDLDYRINKIHISRKDIKWTG